MRRSSGRPRRVLPGYPSYDPESVGRQVLSGRPLHWRHRLAGVLVVAGDIDVDAGVAAVWMARRARWPNAGNEICQFERAGGRWQYLGGADTETKLLLAGRPSASRAGPASMMTILSGCAGRSRAEREAQGRYQDDLAEVGWAACAMFRVAAEVAYLQVGARQVKVPGHGYVIVAWKAPPSPVSPPRPPIAAISDDGKRLTELGPTDHLDSLTWASLQGD